MIKSLIECIQDKNTYFSKNTSIEYDYYGYRVFYRGNLIIIVDTLAKTIHLDSYSWTYKTLQKRMRDVLSIYTNDIEIRVVDDALCFYKRGEFLGRDIVCINY